MSLKFACGVDSNSSFVVTASFVCNPLTVDNHYTCSTIGCLIDCPAVCYRRLICVCRCGCFKDM